MHVFGYDLAGDLAKMPELDLLPAETLAPMLQEGLTHHAAGRLLEAGKIYQRVYDENPQNIDVLVLLGILARQAGQYPAAIRLISLAALHRPEDSSIHLNLALAQLGADELESADEACRRVLQLDEANGRAWSLLGDIALRRKKAEEAVTAYVRALKLPSGTARAAQSLGNQLCRETRYEEALRMYARGIAAEPENANLHFSFGAAAVAAGKMKEAKASYLKALRLRPNFPEVYLNLGNLLYDMKIFKAAAASYERAIALRPTYAKAFCNLGNALSELGRIGRSIASYERALELDPETTAARHNLGNALLNNREYVRAEECFRAVLESDPQRAEHHNSLGNALLQQRRQEEARACYLKALELKPNYAVAHINLANTLQEMGRFEEMKQLYRRGLELNPESAGAQYNLALSLLTEGKYPEGWLRHEWRWDFRELHQRRRNFAQPQWRGEKLNGETILLHAEQGLGDTMQFVRYAPLVAERGGLVILEVQPRLQRLLEGIDGVERVLARGDALPEFAWHCPMMSLPLAFRTAVDTIPATTPYLRVDPAAVAAAWRDYPREDERLRVGLAWSGNPHYKGNQQRSIPLEELTALADVSNAVFYSLQFGEAAKQIAAVQDRFPVIDACSRHEDFAETAAFAATLDLVISVDTSTAHLAGAMGLPLWVMLSHLPDWRWMSDREDSPWYPTARLFRQPAAEDWPAVVNAMRDALRNEFKPRKISSPD